MRAAELYQKAEPHFGKEVICVISHDDFEDLKPELTRCQESSGIHQELRGFNYLCLNKVDREHTWHIPVVSLGFFKVSEKPAPPKFVTAIQFRKR